jgi:outer membrane lipoprotein-sorting protein
MRTIVALLIGSAVLVGLGGTTRARDERRASAGAGTADDILARSRAAYASLRSYADTGTVVIEYGPVGAPLREQHAFTTRYRAPRSFYFDFIKDRETDRFVVWSDDEAFHTWWQTTGVAQTYPKGQGAAAFSTGASITKGSLMQISPLLFPQAGLAGTLTEFSDASVAGTEAVAGRPSHTLVGVARSVYQQTGRAVNVRRTTVWIDTETFLVRKVFEDSPEGTAGSIVSRVITTFDPQANPTLDDGRFRFAVPPTRN